MSRNITEYDMQQQTGGGYSNNKNSYGAGSSETSQNVLVFDRKKSEVITVPRENVIYLPPKNATRLRGDGTSRGGAQKEKYYMLCDRVDPFMKTCRNGKKCSKVHANVQGCQRKLIHINWAWRSLEECTYTRFHPGQQVTIREPASAHSDVVDTVDTGYVLFTRCVFDDPTRPATHCAHFYYGRECQMAHRCDFAHVLYINPTAESLQRAPPPSIFGRKRNFDGHGVGDGAAADHRAVERGYGGGSFDQLEGGNNTRELKKISPTPEESHRQDQEARSGRPSVISTPTTVAISGMNSTAAMYTAATAAAAAGTPTSSFGTPPTPTFAAPPFAPPSATTTPALSTAMVTPDFATAAGATAAMSALPLPVVYMSADDMSNVMSAASTTCCPSSSTGPLTALGTPQTEFIPLTPSFGSTNNAVNTHPMAVMTTTTTGPMLGGGNLGQHPMMTVTPMTGGLHNNSDLLEAFQQQNVQSATDHLTTTPGVPLLQLVTPITNPAAATAEDGGEGAATATSTAAAATTLSDFFHRAGSEFSTALALEGGSSATDAAAAAAAEVDGAAAEVDGGMGTNPITSVINNLSGDDQLPLSSLLPREDSGSAASGSFVPPTNGATSGLGTPMMMDVDSRCLRNSIK